MQVVHQTPAFNVVSNTRLLLTGCGRYAQICVDVILQSYGIT